MTYVVGLTGGIGCGKSTVASLFKDLGVPVICADSIAKQLTQPGSAIKHQILAHFGDKIVNDQRQLDRAKLKQIIFQHPEERLWLEHLLHPLILQQIQTDVANLNHDYVIVEIPLLVEVGPLPFIDCVLVVDCPQEQQIKRIKARDQLSEQQIRAILASQATRDQRIQFADDILHNSEDIDTLKARVFALHQRYSAC